MSQQIRKDKLFDILRINGDISHIKDVDSLLDRVLYEARKITNADAGSIFLKRGDKLSFEYVQNDTLMETDGSSNRHIYTKQELPIDNSSLAGYAALNKTQLVIDDVYQLNNNVPYTFNRSYDKSSKYHTQSVLTVPLITSRDKLIGVIQIINAKDRSHRNIAFSRDDELLVGLFAGQAAVAIERAQITREIILRMIQLAEYRDPMETGGHVQRVASFSIEVYQRWARKKGVEAAEIKHVRDILRIASMLHDVGKVAIADAILKKNTRLNPEEREIMMLHTVYGARLFKNRESDWDDMAADIALNHHEKWDGSGYPGNITDIYSRDLHTGPGKKGCEIPLVARIVSLADVYDALMSHRSYKDAWPEERVLDLIQDEKSKHFDPDIVEAFLEIYDVIKAIRKKYEN